VLNVLELFLKTGFICPCLVIMLRTTLSALAALTGAHVKPLLWKNLLPFINQILCQPQI
jgi:hypothetical protein